MIPIEKLKDYAKKLEFTMEESEYTTLQSEIEGLKDYEPMSFPFKLESSYLREDVVDDEINTSDALFNAKDKMSDRVKVPKVVE